MKFKQVLTAEWLQNLQNILWALAEGENIKSGENIRKKSGPGFVLLSGAAGGGGFNQATACQLYPFASKNDSGDNAVGVTWGTINDAQPKGFHAGGFPTFFVSTTSDDGFIYAKDRADLDTLQWVDPEVVLSSEAKTNTVDTAFLLMGTFTINKDRQLRVVGVCGPARMDICDLLSA